jgi:predicted nucleic acid-binding protein
MAYLDTSVLAAYYCPERLSGKVQKALAGIQDPAISPLVELELHSAAAQKVRTRELAGAAARRVISQFQLHLAEGHYREVPTGAREYELAREWIAGFSAPLRTLDALHLAAAFANELTLLTADRSLARSARHFGVKVELIA